MCTELTINVPQKSVTDIFQPRLLCSHVRVMKRSKANAPCIDNKLLALCGVQFAKENQAVRASVTHICGDFLGGANNHSFELRASQFGHDVLLSMDCAS